MIRKVDSFISNFWVKLKIVLALCLPLGFYIYFLKNLSQSRLVEYAGLLGRNPKSALVYHDIVLVDLSDMQI